MPPSGIVRHSKTLDDIRLRTWQARLPLEIKLSASESRLYDESSQYVISFPRLSYLPFLLARVFDHFSEELIVDLETVSPETGYFTYEGVPLRWHLPVGLLYDMYVLSTQDANHRDSQRPSVPERKAEPFRLTVHFSQSSASTQQLNLINPAPTVVHDSFINSVKEADFLRSGTAKPIMSLSAADSKLLWSATQDNDLATFSRIFQGLLPVSTPWRNLPLRIYLPFASTDTEDEPQEAETGSERAQDKSQKPRPQGQIRVIQSQVSPYLPASTATATSQMRLPMLNHDAPQTIGTALHALLPSLFPSRRTPILATPILHGAPVPMNAALEELASKACYADGWVNIVVAITA